MIISHMPVLTNCNSVEERLLDFPFKAEDSFEKDVFVSNRKRARTAPDYAIGNDVENRKYP